MNAETPKAPELNLPQAFLLLATNDQNGKPEVPVFALRTTLAGAILAELELAGAIGLQGKNVRATAAAPPTEFQHELGLIRGKSRPHTPKRWVAMLEGRAEVQRVYEGMASLGIVEPVGEKHLGLFKSTRYPEKDHGPEAALLKKIEAALSGAPADAGGAASTAAPDAGTSGSASATTAGAPEARAPETGSPEAGAPDAGTPAAKAPEAGKRVAAAPDPRTTALIALLQAAGLFGKLFPAADRSYADELAKDYWPARAVEDELRMIRLAQEEAATL